jgi:hypothetical protein
MDRAGKPRHRWRTAGADIVGGYFTINVPAAWVVDETERVDLPGSNIVYSAYEIATDRSCTASISIWTVNPPADTGMSLAEYRQLTEADMVRTVMSIQKVGWSLQSITKFKAKVIPALHRIERSPWSSTVHTIELLIAGRKFAITVGFWGNVLSASVGGILKSIRPMISLTPEIPHPKAKQQYSIGKI